MKPQINGFPIERKKLTDLKPADWNPRQISDEQANALRRSLAEFGVVEPIVWNATTQHVIGGHQRLDALLALSETETDVVVVELSEEREKLLNVALNKIHGEWEDSKLRDLLNELVNGDEDVTLSGFSEEEIKQLLALPPNFLPVSEDEQPRLDEKSKIECPECGHKFAP